MGPLVMKFSKTLYCLKWQSSRPRWYPRCTRIGRATATSTTSAIQCQKYFPKKTKFSQKTTLWPRKIIYFTKKLASIVANGVHNLLTIFFTDSRFTRFTLWALAETSISEGRLYGYTWNSVTLSYSFSLSIWTLTVLRSPCRSSA